MKKLMHLLFLSCLKATGLIEKKMLFRLTRTEKMQLKVHKLLCTACSNYDKQSTLIEKGIAHSTQATFSAEDLARLKMAIHQKLESLN